MPTEYHIPEERIETGAAREIYVVMAIDTEGMIVRLKAAYDKVTAERYETSWLKEFYTQEVRVTVEETTII